CWKRIGLAIPTLRSPSRLGRHRRMPQRPATRAFAINSNQLFWQCSTGWGLTPWLGQPSIRARALLRMHRETYRAFWAWSDHLVDYAILTGSLHTVFAWRVRVPQVANERSL